MSHKENPNQPGQLILDNNLQGFFLDQLLKINQQTNLFLPTETLYYSSLVLDKYSESKQFFENINGQVREKRLGIKLLESTQLSTLAQKRELKDIADTALFLCGHFSDSLNNKVIDINYYHNLGKIAYSRLDSLVPQYLEIQSFYSTLAKEFDHLTSLMIIMAKKNL